MQPVRVTSYNVFQADKAEISAVIDRLPVVTSSADV